MLLIRKPEYFHRDFENDLPSPDKVSIFVRIAGVALPFLALYQPLGKVISISANLSRVWANVQGGDSITLSVLKKAIPIISIAGTIFLHPIGMVITNVQDIGLNLYHIGHGIKEKEYYEVAKKTLQLTNNVFYLMTMFSFSLPLQIASLSIQIIVGSVSSIDEFRKGNILEGSAGLLMVAFRVNYQLLPNIQKLQRKWEIDALIKRVFVGKLAEKWQFPSDHLPVGAEVNGVKIISWNVLNNAYMEWVTEKDSQGLNHSMISDLDVQVQPDGLTRRDILVTKLVHDMMESSQGIVALQECGEPFLKKIESELPANWKIARSFDAAVEDQDVILYNSSALHYRFEQSGVTASAYPSEPGRPIQHALFERRDTQERMHVVNGHIPGNPHIPGREEFAKYVMGVASEGYTTVALGDNNFDREEMLDAYRKAGFDDFELHSPWQTNIDPYTKESKAIDHIFVLGASSSRSLAAEEVLEDGQLKETIELLRNGG